MSGIGGDCGLIDSAGISCLRTGRINVWNNTRASDHHKAKRHNCGYRQGVTSGVMCCKKGQKSLLNNKKSKFVHYVAVRFCF